MSKNIFIILMVCLALVGLVSCTNEIEPAQEELIYVSFENRSSRALTASLEGFDVDAYFWSYEAQKSDGSGLKSGETGWDETGELAVPVQEGEGLSTIVEQLKTPTKVPGFSKGYWNFRLFAFKDASREQLAYWGEADAVLISDIYHTASVTVSPVSGGSGYLKVGNISFKPASSISTPTELVIYTDTIWELDEEEWVPVDVQPVDGIYTLPAKQYRFTREYSYDSISVTSGSVIVTIYSNLTTTVSGSLSELTTYADFVGKQNPDAVNVVASVDSLYYGDPTATHTLVVDSSSKVEAIVTQGSVDNIISVTASKLNIGLDENTSTEMTLSLGVDTVASTATSVVYEINMTAEINYKKTVGEQTVLDETTTADVKAVKEYVTATIQMQTGLLYVSVLHDGNLMADSTNTDDDEGYGIYSYDSSTGVLTIVTKTFSPFAVNFSFPKDEGVARIGNVYYNSLEDAVAAVPTNGVQTVIFMLKDTSVVAGVTIDAGKNVALELNGKTISGNTDSSTTYALITNRGTLTIQDLTDTEKNGTGSGLLTTYISNPDHQDVPGYASNTITNNGTLTVESGKIVNNGTGYACYAIDNQTNGNSYIPVLIINGGRFEQMNAYTYAIRMFCNSTTKTNSVTVNGGVITGGYGLWLQSPNANRNMASLTITGGLIEAKDGLALFIGGTKSDRSATTVRISGGEIKGSGVGFQEPLSGRYGHLTITGGEFENVQCGSNVDNFITGGVFSNDPSAYVAEGYFADDDDQTQKWTVYPIPAAPPTAIVELITDPEQYMQEGADLALKAVDTGVVISFKPEADPSSDEYVEDAIEAYYKDWYVDFRITALSDFAAESCGILGQYFNWPWINMDLPDPVGNGFSFQLMEDALHMSGFITYETLLDTCKTVDNKRETFNCGAYYLDESIEGQKTIKLELILVKEGYNPVVCQLESVSGVTDASAYIKDNAVICDFHLSNQND